MLSNLPDNWQRILWLCEVERLSPEAVAEQLNIKASTVERLADRAHQGLQDEWQKVRPTDSKATVDHRAALIPALLTSPIVIERLSATLAQAIPEPAPAVAEMTAAEEPAGAGTGIGNAPALKPAGAEANSGTEAEWEADTAPEAIPATASSSAADESAEASGTSAETASDPAGAAGSSAGTAGTTAGATNTVEPVSLAAFGTQSEHSDLDPDACSDSVQHAETCSDPCGRRVHWTLGNACRCSHRAATRRADGAVSRQRGHCSLTRRLLLEEGGQEQQLPFSQTARARTSKTKSRDPGNRGHPTPTGTRVRSHPGTRATMTVGRTIVRRPRTTPTTRATTAIARQQKNQISRVRRIPTGQILSRLRSRHRRRPTTLNLLRTHRPQSRKTRRPQIPHRQMSPPIRHHRRRSRQRIRVPRIRHHQMRRNPVRT